MYLPWSPLSCSHRRRLLHGAVDAILIAAAGLCAFLLRFEFAVPAKYIPMLQAALAVWIAVKLAVFYWRGLDLRAWQFSSVADLLQLAEANLIASAGASAILLPLLKGFPRSVCILDLVLCFLFFSGRFLGRRILVEQRKALRPPGVEDVFIYGAGQSGVALYAELSRNTNHSGYRVRGFIDDDPALAGMYVHGQPVLGPGSRLEALRSRFDVRRVLIAMPSASAQELETVVQHCQRAGLQYRTVPTLTEMVDSATVAPLIREVDVQDLLARDPVLLDQQLLRERIAGRMVMVTGAGGSIGAELCRQLVRFRPAGLVAFELAETPLFHLGREMQERFPDVPFHGEIGSVQNERRVAAILARYRPATIYHAAAYKHVPIMESSVIEAVSNNVLGTQTLAQSACEHGVSEFVLISSDKAVRPTSVMGATKRLCERLILEMAGACGTRFMAVRFGNVLGSNGSVIPLFKQQIAAGGPVTVTHPEMRRFFMTIPEAAQLVLQAAAMGEGGEIFVLEMGEQMKVVDIARKLIMLSGLRPDVDIQIQFSGIRPGEKLYEELNLEAETTLPTRHRKIKIFAPPPARSLCVAGQTERLRELCEEGRATDLVRLIRQLVPEYQPSSLVLSMSGDRGVEVLRRAAATL